ncbi:hypothetical protein TWF481_006080 [Arthrobotrys musiformis]|uniref:Uncharacterized protein n=1 Tax=Arthrobotrys musiformis TaxID=47236 RepID=A0AAV9WHP2_9PEZI
MGIMDDRGEQHCQSMLCHVYVYVHGYYYDVVADEQDVDKAVYRKRREHELDEDERDLKADISRLWGYGLGRDIYTTCSSKEVDHFVQVLEKDHPLYILQADDCQRFAVRLLSYIDDTSTSFWTSMLTEVAYGTVNRFWMMFYNPIAMKGHKASVGQEAENAGHVEEFI